MLNKALSTALRLLTRRDHGALELCEKLERKGFSSEEAQEALLECQRLGFQSDLRFVENYSRSRGRQGYGPLKIIHELKSKGVECDLIHQVIIQEQDQWVNVAKDVWYKKTKRQADRSFSELQKQQRFLQYRGFSMDIIAQVMKEVAS